MVWSSTRRAACSAIELGVVLVGTPDLDVYEEDYRAGSLGVDIARVVFSPVRWPPPPTATSFLRRASPSPTPSLRLT